jgi:hypothetical protein
MTKPSEPPLDDACSSFVHWLTSRTLEGRARWEEHPNGLISQLTASMFAQFITHCSPQGQSWRLFRVRDSNGEVLRTTVPVSGVGSSPLAIAVEALYLTITWSGPHSIH